MLRAIQAMYVWHKAMFSLDFLQKLGSRQLADRKNKLRCWHTSYINKSGFVYDVSWRGDVRHTSELEQDRLRCGAT